MLLVVEVSLDGRQVQRGEGPFLRRQPDLSCSTNQGELYTHDSPAYHALAISHRMGALMHVMQLRGVLNWQISRLKLGGRPSQCDPSSEFASRGKICSGGCQLHGGRF